MRHKKQEDICAGSVLIYKNFVVLLYDHKRRYYVQPHGHLEKGEIFKETALRETREETGYINLRYVKKLGQHQYHFISANRVIYKKVHIYLVELVNLKKGKKARYLNEHFSNRFFSFSEAIRKARWEEDKKFIRRAQQHLFHIRN